MHVQCDAFQFEGECDVMYCISVTFEYIFCGEMHVQCDAFKFGGECYVMYCMSVYFDFFCVVKCMCSCDAFQFEGERKKHIAFQFSFWCS